MRRPLGLALLILLTLLWGPPVFGRQPTSAVLGPDVWVLEGTDGTTAEYIYVTGKPGEFGHKVGWDFGAVGIMDVEPGPPVPSGYFAWVAPSSVTVLGDVYNIPRYSATYGRRLHHGLDLGSDGLTIYSAYGGTIAERWTHADAGHTSDTMWGTFARIVTNYGTGQTLQHIYGHWDTFDALDTTPTKGKSIGTMGDGHGIYVGSEHLHFGTRDSSGNDISPAPYFSASNPVPPSAMEFIRHTPATRYTSGAPLTISFTSGRSDQVKSTATFEPKVFYRAKGITSYTSGTMTLNGSTWSYTIPGSFTSTCAQLEYYVRVYRKYHALMNPVEDNYATRPVYGASAVPPTPYLVTAQ